MHHHCQQTSQVGVQASCASSPTPEINPEASDRVLKSDLSFGLFRNLHQSFQAHAEGLGGLWQRQLDQDLALDFLLATNTFTPRTGFVPAEDLSEREQKKLRR